MKPSSTRKYSRWCSGKWPKRGKGKKYHSGVHAFSTKIKCGECGSWYGSKVWHSNSKYRKTIWQCNHKFDGDCRCQTPHLTDEEIQLHFLSAANKLLADKGCGHRQRQRDAGTPVRHHRAGSGTGPAPRRNAGGFRHGTAGHSRERPHCSEPDRIPETLRQLGTALRPGQDPTGRSHRRDSGKADGQRQHGNLPECL